MYSKGNRQTARTSCISEQQLSLINTLHRLAEQSVYRLRAVLTSIFFELPDRAANIRLLESAGGDIAAVLRRYYGDQRAQECARLVAGRYRLVASLLSARLELKVADSNRLRSQWAQNGRLLARGLHLLNPYWEEQQWNQLLFLQMKALEKAFEDKSEGDWYGEASRFDELEERALQMADYLARGIVQQFVWA